MRKDLIGTRESFSVRIICGFIHRAGAHTQAELLDELQKNLKEVVELCVEEMDSETKDAT